MPFITQGKTNWKFLLIVIILVVVVGGGVFAWQYWWAPKEEVKAPEVKAPKEITITSPSKGEIWKVGGTYQIRWIPSDPKGTVGIILSDTGISSASLSKIWQVENIPDAGNYSFTVPEVLPGDAYQIYISSKEKYGYSELFSIISKDETADWQTYRNEEYGLEIKYPEYFSNTLEEGGLIFAKSFYNSKYNENPFGECGGFQFEKHENHLKDWVEFAKKQYEYNKVEENGGAYGLLVTEFQGLKSIQFYSEDGFIQKDAFLTVDGIHNGEGGEVFVGPEVLKVIYFEKDGYLWRLIFPDTELFNQMLSTFKFIETESQEAATNFCKEKEGYVKYLSLLNFNEDGDNEILVICGDSSEWSVGSEIWNKNFYILDKQNQDYKLIWQRNTSKDFYLTLYTIRKPEINDVDKDGIDEIFFTGSIWGGTCTGASDLFFLYSPKYNELFYIEVRDEFDSTCTTILTSTKDSDNLGLEKYEAFKEFLEQKSKRE